MTAKITLLDIETSPNISYTWGMWEQNVIAFEEEWGILCYGHKELYEEQVHIVSRRDFKGYKKDLKSDYAVCERLHQLLDASDVVIAHNGDRFDIRKINARLLFHGFDPPSPYQTIDTLKIARRHFAFNSNKLNDLAVHLHLGEKEKHAGFETWLGCMRGDPGAWEVMENYCGGDVNLLEDVYIKIRPWAEGTPNLAFLNDLPDGCAHCGCINLSRQGTRKTKTLSYYRYQCGDCGGWSRGRLAIKDADKALTVI